MNVRWSHCVLRVRDVPAMTRFYCDALGFHVVDSGTVGEGTEIVFLSGDASDHHQLALTSGRDGSEATSLDHNAFRVDSVADVQRMIEWVHEDERISDGFPVTHGNAVSVYFKDPEGNGIEIFADTPWHVPQPVVKGWDPSMGADEVLADIESRFKDTAGFMSMRDYRSAQAATFGETRS